MTAIQQTTHTNAVYTMCIHRFNNGFVIAPFVYICLCLSVWANEVLAMMLTTVSTSLYRCCFLYTFTVSPYVSGIVNELNIS